MILGIMGGMGPAATCDLFRKITELTHASKDQEHIHIIIDSNVQIPDRTRYICGEGEDPKIEMIRSATRLEMMGADYMAIPCNTAHYFYDSIIPYTKIPILHMIRETAAYLKKTYPIIRDYLLLATQGTYISGIYKNIFSGFGLNIIEPSNDDKKIVMNWIYKVKSGTFDVMSSEYEALINKYTRDREVPTILGCTELPLLVEKIDTNKDYVDPLLILAQCCVDIAQGRKELAEEYAAVCGGEL